MRFTYFFISIHSLVCPPPPFAPVPFLNVTKTVREFLNFASKSVTAFKIYQTIVSFFKSNLAFYYTIKKIESVSSLAISASNKYYAFTNYSIHCQLCPPLLFKENGRKKTSSASQKYFVNIYENSPMCTVQLVFGPKKLFYQNEQVLTQ